MRIQSPRPAEPETDDPEAVEPEMTEEEAAAQVRERDERSGHRPEVGEPVATEPAAEDDGHVGRESRAAESETEEPAPGIHEHAGREFGADEPGAREPGIRDHFGREHEADEVDEPTGSAPEPGVYEHVGQEPGADESAAVPSHTGTYGSADEERTAYEPDVDDFAAAGAVADEPVPYTPVRAESGATAPAPTTEPPEFGAPLITADESARFHEQIHQIQGTFVDDPRQSVRDAEHLLEDIVRSLAAGLEERRRALTSLSSEDGSGTEELRQALRSYRSLATQLLGPEI